MREIQNKIHYSEHEVNDKRGFIHQTSMFHQQYKCFEFKHTDTDIDDITSKILKKMYLGYITFVVFKII